MGFGAGTAFGNMGVSVHRAEVPIKKFKNISSCPHQGSLSVAFTNASVFGSQFAASVAICACAWEKKEKKQKTKTTNPPQPVVDSNAEETQTAAERLWPAVQRAMLQHGSTKPGLTLQYQALHPRPRAQPPGAPAQERPSPDPHLLSQ